MEWNPGPKYRLYVNAVNDVLESDEDDRTVRDIYYALESRGFESRLRDESYEHALSKHHDDPEKHSHPDYVSEDEWLWDFTYKFVKYAVKNGRRAGYIDPTRIFDASRRAEATVPQGYGDPTHFVGEVVDNIHKRYWENPWRDQSHYVEVWLEKQSLATVFEPICSDKKVRLEATRGDWSDSKVHQACQRILARVENGKDVRILYFGDYNPSGLHAPVVVQKTMQHYGLEIERDFDSDDAYFDIWPLEAPVELSSSDGSLMFERVALNLEHIEKYDLPENPTPSSSDKDKTIRERFMQHASGGRDVNIELNALKEFHRDDLEEMLEDAIDQYRDEELWTESVERIGRRRGSIETAITVDESELPD